ncbi:short-chain dehydrogenase [Bosea thiooxidans]|uniref:NAD(P)-dependent dehydrogenase, short-chain alcohol dehydrogenase family n=1 Tax=Bosea thiooxidans TaxID=53254 RepID=A0A0Q3I7R0_9HYPH|nr:SDR family NAD(P)-dependent oxidoreductase [Bosea thiooxidans]KQK31064.1 short-chain dehydrogenase [Bosea thiooxidans]SKB90625.1 NAD(P)-dependent dehydrogenase, short-chain alcohol dehydrogenase family [Bosea thiooxidans]
MNAAQSSLAGRICLVAGASRGLGRGIARALGEAGATVIVTGRSSEAGPRTDQRSETFEDTAREVEAAGGKGYPYRCDHTNEREVDGLVAWALRRFGRLDCVVDAVWGGNEGYDGERYPDGSGFGTPFWRRPAARLGESFESGVYAQLLLARAVAPAMVQMRSGLVVTVSFDTAGGYLGDVFYDLAKAAMNRLTFAMAQELAPFGVTALAISPGHVLTERVRDAGLADATTESPLYAGRAVAALVADPEVARHAGHVLPVADLARAYGFTDRDGSQPERFIITNQRGGGDVAQG